MKYIKNTAKTRMYIDNGKQICGKKHVYLVLPSNLCKIYGV
jgi:hypothetical protein